VKSILIAILALVLYGCASAGGDISSNDVKSKEQQIKEASDKLNGPSQNRDQGSGQ